MINTWKRSEKAILKTRDNCWLEPFPACTRWGQFTCTLLVSYREAGIWNETCSVCTCWRHSDIRWNRSVVLIPGPDVAMIDRSWTLITSVSSASMWTETFESLTEWFQSHWTTDDVEKQVPLHLPNSSSSLSPCRSLRSATPPPPRSWATTGGTTSSLGWSRRTASRPRPWWTSSRPWAGTTSPPWPRRAATGRREWTPSCSSPEKQVSPVSWQLLWQQSASAAAGVRLSAADVSP